MGFRSMIPGREIENIKEDKKKATGVEQYMISENAIYSRGEYLPVSAVSAVKIQPSTYIPACACGKGIPVFKIRVDYGAEKPVIFMLEKEKNAEKMLSIIQASRPDLRIERENGSV